VNTTPLGRRDSNQGEKGRRIRPLLTIEGGRQEVGKNIEKKNAPFYRRGISAQGREGDKKRKGKGWQHAEQIPKSRVKKRAGGAQQEGRFVIYESGGGGKAAAITKIGQVKNGLERTTGESLWIEDCI